MVFAGRLRARRLVLQCLGGLQDDLGRGRAVLAEQATLIGDDPHPGRARRQAFELNLDRAAGSAGTDLPAVIGARIRDDRHGKPRQGGAGRVMHGIDWGGEGLVADPVELVLDPCPHADTGACANNGEARRRASLQQNGQRPRREPLEWSESPFRRVPQLARKPTGEPERASRSNASTSVELPTGARFRRGCPPSFARLPVSRTPSLGARNGRSARIPLWYGQGDLPTPTFIGTAATAAQAYLLCPQKRDFANRALQASPIT